MGSHAMYVRQIGGTGVYAGVAPKGDAILRNSATDPAKDATYDALGQTSANMPNLDIALVEGRAGRALNSCHPAGTPCLRVSMKLANLSTAAPASPDTDNDLVWLTQWSCRPRRAARRPRRRARTAARTSWSTPSRTTAAPIQCFVGPEPLLSQNGALGLQLTYPARRRSRRRARARLCPASNGTITIDVPLSQVSLDPGVAPFSAKLYSVTASTMTLPQPANTSSSSAASAACRST